jgi:hypothetical protein
VGFRGAFTLDGVLTAQGFLPTELNPRYGAGFGTMAKALTELPLELVDLAICEGEPWDFRADELEAWWLEGADRVRSGGGWTISRLAVEENRTWRLALDGDGCREAREDEKGDADMLVGPASAGSLVRFTPDADYVRLGTSVAPLVAKAFRWSDEHLGTGFGHIEPARDAR